MSLTVEEFCYIRSQPDCFVIRWIKSATKLLKSGTLPGNHSHLPDQARPRPHERRTAYTTSCRSRTCPICTLIIHVSARVLRIRDKGGLLCSVATELSGGGPRGREQRQIRWRGGLNNTALCPTTNPDGTLSPHVESARTSDLRTVSFIRLSGMQW
jgi:hypothetical protein